MKKYSIACIIGLLSVNFIFSQSDINIQDSLAKYDFETLEQMYYESLDPDPQLAKTYAFKLLDKASNTKEKIKALYLAGTNETVYQAKGEQFNKSLSYIDEAIKISKKYQDSSLLGDLYESKGFIYYSIHKDFDPALSYYLEGLEIAKKQQNTILQLKLEHKIAALYFSIGDIDTALAKNKVLYKKIQNTTVPYHIKIRILKSLSNNYLKQFSMHENEKIFLDSLNFFGLQALKLSKKENKVKDISFMHNLLGASFYFQEIYDKALYHLNISESISKQHGIGGRMASIYHYKGNIFLKQNLLDSAVYYFKKNEPILKDTSKVFFLFSDTYALLAECYEKKGDYKEALGYSKLAIDYKEATVQKKEGMRFTLEKKYDLPALKEKYTALQKKMNKTTFLKNVLVYLIIGLGIIFMLSFIYFKRRERQNKLHFEKIIRNLNTKEDIVKTETNVHIELNIPKDKIENILKGLENFENGDLFIKPNCTLNFLAKKLHTNTSYLSQIINHYKEKSYPDYLTDLRITYVLKRLKNDTLFRAYSIKSIAEEVGYKSSKSFSKAFKNATGIYPSYYIKNLDN